MLKILEIIKIITPILSTIILLLLLKPSFLTFFQSTSSEKKLLSKEVEIAYKTFLFLVLFILSPVLYTYPFFESINSKLLSFLGEDRSTSLIKFTIWANVILGWGYYILVLKYFKEFVELRRSYKNAKNKIRKYRDKRKITYINLAYLITALLVLNTILCAFFMGFIHSSLYISNNELLDVITIILFSILLFLPNFFSYNYINTPLVKIHKIVLTDGVTIVNKYLSHRTFKNNILIRDHPDQKKNRKLILVKSTEIVYWELEEEYIFRVKNNK
ncbi:hypothetical protein [Halobacillus sp. B29]|uniref:hypothetical protein n=1 Tax=Halobacillus sp. B29 TaxID=3457432 RepID=UPI003FCDEEC4